MAPLHHFLERRGHGSSGGGSAGRGLGTAISEGGIAAIVVILIFIAVIFIGVYYHENKKGE
jgi:hypothetical protein